MKAKPISTATQVAAVKPGVHKVAGAEGLYLTKNASGSGSWFYRYTVGTGAKRREMGLGSIADVTLAQAREAAWRLKDQHRLGGVDPIAARERARAEAEARARAEAKKITFAQATEAYVDRNAPSWKHKYARPNWLNPIVKYAYPVVGDLLLDEIGVEHIAEVTDAARKAPYTARAVRQRIERILDDATRRGFRSATIRNPAESKLHRDGRRRGERKHYRRLELDDAPAVLCALLALAANRTAFAAWVFMIATAVRGSEALKARWNEINLEKKLWTIPAARMKSDRTHVVPLSSLALLALERQAKVRSGDAVFPSPRGGVLSYNSFATAPGDAGLDAGTPHSWRSVFRDVCGDRLRVDRDLAEAALAHTLGGTEGAYRRETAIEARRPVMEAYAKWLAGEPSGNVVAFPARG